MKRQRKVFRNYDECAHVWAQQKQESGSSNGRRMYFEGKSIYSYGPHFEIARFVKPGVVLETTRTYSNTTRTHQSAVSGAVGHLKSFDVPSFTDHKENVQHFMDSAAARAQSMKRARSGATQWELAWFRKILKTGHDYVSTFRRDIDIDTAQKFYSFYRNRRKLLTDKDIRVLRERCKLWTARAEDRRRRKSEIRQAEWRSRELAQAAMEVWGTEVYRLNGEAWKAGDRLREYQGPVLLRVKGAEIETTRGAYVPIEGAKELWAMIKEHRPVHGFEIGHYTVTGLIDGKLVIGCHEIPLREVARMARVLGLEMAAA